jgi:hypothetical protein
MADQCAIRSGWEASRRQISSALWNVQEDRPEQAAVNPKRWFERNHPGGAVTAVTAERPLAERQVQRRASLTQDRAKQSNMSKAIFR